MLRHLRFGLLSASALAISATGAFADFELNILHINDFHSRIEAINKFDSTCSTEEAGKNECFGGIARMKSAIDTRRNELAGKNILTLDAGDQFQGSLFYTTYKSAPIAEFMNGIGFDAIEIGNHEFDDGPEELAKFIEALKFPMISGNTLAGLDSPVADKFKPYIIKEFGSEKVAVVGVLATDTDETSSPGDSILFAEPIGYLKEAVKEIEAQGVNKIVLLSHVGYTVDQRIAAAVDGIDVIVGGHSHTLLSSTDEKAVGPYPTLVKNPSGKEVPIVTAYAYSKYLGDLKVVFDDAGAVKSAEGAPILLDASVTPDAGYTAKVAELAGPIEELKKKEIGETAEMIEGSREVCRVKECTMGNLVADAMVDRVKDQGITIAIQNGGGLRASIDAGTVSMGEVLTVLPFQNTLATFRLKGSDIVAALENGLSQIQDGAGRFPQVSGLKYSFDKSQEPGKRVVSVEVKEGDAFVPLDPEKLYGVATNNYMRAGGDGYKIFATAGQNAYDFGPGLETVVADYLAKNAPYKPYTDGRITEVASSAAVEATVTEPAAPAGPAATAETAAPASAAATAAATVYKVVSGDSLWKIAAATYGDGMMWKKIAEANALKNPNIIGVGKELQLPAK
ncbi:5'-nucleotidase C-terminal domain-containing protein [Rhizobium sp. S95]|uniref:5'-nucleotidase C-terminal domain-containing protein n=1 Tax=Ciceribacter sichuanensis TaxID=2949647 RepID=A0AAJ1BYG7_9HYPH|nr:MULTISPECIES: 5'-nucleotidase C-terminal domain-containing protein [unclassified Ciceribacter]MCM2398504.1 5'-nucleotidase C-terminal domain-containing protein [Ciceribacter sp. S95]MCO5958509.1 5'-nucleotidase C-terminal domain-containing protein [Ciceribacter sp. S101]